MSEEVQETQEVEDVVTPEAESETPEPSPVSDEVRALKQGIAQERKKRQLAEQEAQRAWRESQASRQTLEPEVERPDQGFDFDAEFNARMAHMKRMERVESWRNSMPEVQQRYEGVDLNEAVDAVGTTLGRYGQAGQEIADQVIGSERSWDVIAHLHQNPDQLQRLSQMTPIQAAMEIARIEARVQGGGQSVSSAPPPIRPQGSRAMPTKDPDDMSLREYEEWAKAQRGGSTWPK